LRLKIRKKLSTANLNSEFTGSYKNNVTKLILLQVFWAGDIFTSFSTTLHVLSFALLRLVSLQLPYKFKTVLSKQTKVRGEDVGKDASTWEDVHKSKERGRSENVSIRENFKKGSGRRRFVKENIRGR